MATDVRLQAMDLMLRAMRQALEDVLSPTLVSDALFEALDENAGEIPGTSEELTRFLRSHLRSALARRLDNEIADNAVRSLESLMPGSVDGPRVPAGPMQAPIIRERQRPEQATLRMERDSGPVRTLVVARRAGLAACLHVALGRENVNATTALSAYRIEMALSKMEPSVVVVVADDLEGEEEVQSTVRALADIPRQVQRVVWGHDSAGTKRIMDLLEANGQPAITVDRSEGPAPLLDLFRARTSAGR